MSKPREWYIPASVGGFYNGKRCMFAVGPIVDGPLPNPGGFAVVEKSAYDTMLADARRLADTLNNLIEQSESDTLYYQDWDDARAALTEWSEKYGGNK